MISFQAEGNEVNGDIPQHGLILALWALKLTFENKVAIHFCMLETGDRRPETLCMNYDVVTDLIISTYNVYILEMLSYPAF